MRNLIAVVLISFSLFAKGSSTNTVMLLDEYHSLCSNAVFKVQTGLSDNTVANADDVYLVGWLHAQEAVPFLLNVIDCPSRRDIQNGDPSGDLLIRPITTPHPPPPQPPALGALLFLECPIHLITNAIVVADDDEPKIRSLVRLGQQKFAGDFELLLAELASTGEPIWQNAVRCLEEDPFYRGVVWVKDRLPYFPQDSVKRYVEIFWTFRMAAEEAEKQGDEPLFSEMCNALSEIGHPFDEDRSLWPW